MPLSITENTQLDLFLSALVIGSGQFVDLLGQWRLRGRFLVPAENHRDFLTPTAQYLQCFYSAPLRQLRFGQDGVGKLLFYPFPELIGSLMCECCGCHSGRATSHV